MKLEQHQSFTDIYDLKELADIRPDAGTKVHVATIQGLAQSGTQLVWALGVLPYARKAEDVPLYMAVHTTLTGVRGVIAPYFGIWLAGQVGLRAALVMAGCTMVATGLATLAFVDPREAGPARE